MDLSEIQRLSLEDSRRWFPQLHDSLDHQATHFTLGLIGEAGEVANVVKKVMRGDKTWEAAKVDLGAEMADVLTYLCDMAESLGINLAAEWHAKRRFNEERFGR